MTRSGGPDAYAVAVLHIVGMIGVGVATALVVVRAVRALATRSPRPAGDPVSQLLAFGIIANLAAFFALHNLFDHSRRITAGPVDLEVPVLSSADPVAFTFTAVAIALVFGLKWSSLRTLGVCAALGLLSALVA